MNFRLIRTDDELAEYEWMGTGLCASTINMVDIDLYRELQQYKLKVSIVTSDNQMLLTNFFYNSDRKVMSVDDIAEVIGKYSQFMINKVFKTGGFF